VKIYIIGPAHPYRGGIADSGMRLAQELQKVGEEVHLINFTKQYPSFLFPGKTQYSEEEPPKGLRIRRMIHSFNPFNWVKVGFTLKSERPDLVIVRFWLPFMGLAFGTICRIIRANRYTTILSIPDNIKPHEKRIGDRILTRYFVASVDKFIALSAGVRQDLKEFTDKPAIILPHPIYDIFGDKIDKGVAKEKFGLKPNDKAILFFGLIRDYKGLDLLLEAMLDERMKSYDVKLIVAGEYYSNREFYESFIINHNLSAQIIKATHFITNSEVSQYFSAADLVVQPYKTATQSGITQIALHFSKPMIVTNVGGLPEVVKDQVTGFVVDQHPESIADAVIKFYDLQLEAAFTESVEKEKKKYQWSFFVKKLLEFYKG